MPSRRRKRFVILASRFNLAISRRLVQGACDVLRRAGVPARQVRLLWVPGAFELPVVAARVVAGRRRPDAVIAVGALIRGQTPQHEVIAHAVAESLAHLSVTSGVPVTFGIIVAPTLAHAAARANGPRANRGAEAALAALAVLRLFETLI